MYIIMYCPDLFLLFSFIYTVARWIYEYTTIIKLSAENARDN